VHDQTVSSVPATAATPYDTVLFTSELKYLTTASLEKNTTIAPARKKATIREAIVDGSNHPERKTMASFASCQKRSISYLLSS